MDEARHELLRKARVKTFTSTDFEGRYYDDGWVEIFLASERVDSAVLDK